MIGILIYAVASFGLHYILGHAMLTRAPREWAQDFGMFYRLVELPPTDVIAPGSTAMMPRIFPLRWLVDLVECPVCCGFHTGFWSWLWLGRVFFDGWLLAVSSLVAGCFIAGSNFLLGRLTGLVPPKEH